MASRIPEDTLRRLKYAVIPVPQPDGSTRYDRDIVHRDERTGNLPNLAKDFSPERGGEGQDTPARDSKGRFTK